jgi:hypothetical protein
MRPRNSRPADLLTQNYKLIINYQMKDIYFIQEKRLIKIKEQ